MPNERQSHAMSRYTRVTEGVIEKLQRDYLAGRSLEQSVPGLNQKQAAVIVAESLEADGLLNTPVEDLFEGRFEPPQTDWGRAVLAEMLFAMADHLRSEGEAAEEHRQELESLAWRVLEQVLDTPTASPLLWYEDIYLAVAQEYRLEGDPHALELLKRGLAHNLRHNDGSNAKNFLLDLADCHLWLGNLDEGLPIYVALLHNEPADIWVYNSAALMFDHVGLTALGLAATQRGLELIEALGDPEELHDQLAGFLDDLRQSEKPSREVDVDPAVLADFRAALALDFDAGRQLPVDELCHEVIPDLGGVPVKRPPEIPDLPPPEVLQGGRPSDEVLENLGRNDPCWCGSGKKYKHCHLRSDQAR